jgi:hypothetical protein
MARGQSHFPRSLLMVIPAAFSLLYLPHFLFLFRSVRQCPFSSILFALPHLCVENIHFGPLPKTWFSRYEICFIIAAPTGTLRPLSPTPIFFSTCRSRLHHAIVARPKDVRDRDRDREERSPLRLRCSKQRRGAVALVIAVERKMWHHRAEAKAVCGTSD